MYFGFFNLGATELIALLAIVLLIFGPKKLPQIGRSFGEMLSNFRKGSGTDKDEAGESDDKQTDDKQADDKQTDGKETEK